MIKTVVWNYKAKLQLIKIINYLQDEFSEKTVKKFKASVKSKINQIKKYPEIGRNSKKRNIRFVKIDKYNNLYYQVKNDKLILVYIFDTRKNPSKNIY